MPALSNAAARVRTSVIIPTFNGAGWVGEAVASVLAQSMGDLELLVIDDGSTDETRQVIEAVRDPRLRYVYQPRAGVSAARNRGLQRASGEFVAWLDADDLWPREYLAAMTAALAAAPDYGVARSALANVYPDGRQRQSSRMKCLASGWVSEELFQHALVYLQGMIMRREAFEGLWFDESLRTCEDLDMGLRLSDRCRFLYVPAVQVVRRVRRGSLSQPTRPDDVDVNNPRVLERFYYRLGGDRRIRPGPARRRLARAYCAAAKRFARFGAWSAARKLFRRALAYHLLLPKAYVGLVKAALHGPSRDSLPGWHEPPPLADPVPPATVG